MPQKKVAEELLTVVIPVYNREKVVMRTLESITHQRVHPSFILVDNGSTDGSYDILEKWSIENPQFNVSVVREMRKGATNARNCGLANVRTPWVMFFDSDDVMLPTHLSSIVSKINDVDDSSVSIIGWDVKMEFEGGGEKIGIFRAEDPIFYSLFNGSMATARWAARTSLVRQAGGWNPDIELWDDIELGLRMLKQNPEIVRLDGEPNVDVFVTRNSITAMSYYDENHRLEHTVKALSGILDGRPEQRYIPLLKAIYAAHYYREGHKDEAKRFYREALSEANTARKPLISFAYRYTRIGGRGIARILKKVF